MEYVEGESLACILRICATRGEPMQPSQASALIGPILHGLHAAHEAKSDQGEPLHLVHRDVSPQNVLIGIDGVPRILDFGVAKALGQSHSTRQGEIKGKLAYMSPEQIDGKVIDRRTDVFAASIVLWESLTGNRLFRAEQESQIMRLVLTEPIKPPSMLVPGISPALDAVVMRGLERDPAKRFPTAEAMADALEEAITPVPTRKLGAWVQVQLSERLVARAKLLKEIESVSSVNGVAKTEGVGEVDVSLDEIMTVAPDSENAPTRIPSQSTSISVAAPLRTSIAPKKAGLSRLVLLACLAAGAGGVVAVLATRGSHDAPSAPTLAAATPPPLPATPPPAPAAPEERPLTPAEREALAPWATPPAPVEPAPAPTPRSPVVRTTPTVSPTPRPKPTAPAPASTLYSRF
jgi:serine/threonine-protein kinase